MTMRPGQFEKRIRVMRAYRMRAHANRATSCVACIVYACGARRLVADSGGGKRPAGELDARAAINRRRILGR
jgi:hypothetical protein